MAHEAASMRTYVKVYWLLMVETTGHNDRASCVHVHVLNKKINACICLTLDLSRRVWGWGVLNGGRPRWCHLWELTSILEQAVCMWIC